MTLILIILSIFSVAVLVTVTPYLFCLLALYCFGIKTDDIFSIVLRGIRFQISKRQLILLDVVAASILVMVIVYIRRNI